MGARGQQCQERAERARVEGWKGGRGGGVVSKAGEEAGTRGGGGERGAEDGRGSAEQSSIPMAQWLQQPPASTVAAGNGRTATASFLCVTLHGPSPDTWVTPSFRHNSNRIFRHGSDCRSTHDSTYDNTHTHSMVVRRAYLRHAAYPAQHHLEGDEAHQLAKEHEGRLGERVVERPLGARPVERRVGGPVDGQRPVGRALPRGVLHVGQLGRDLGKRAAWRRRGWRGWSGESWGAGGGDGWGQGFTMCSREGGKGTRKAPGWKRFVSGNAGHDLKHKGPKTPSLSVVRSPHAPC